MSLLKMQNRSRMTAKKFAIFGLFDRGKGAIIPHKLTTNFDTLAAAEKNLKVINFNGDAVKEFIILPVYILDGNESNFGSGGKIQSNSQQSKVQAFVEKEENSLGVPQPVVKGKNGLVM
jgi:hypothetical protein